MFALLGLLSFRPMTGYELRKVSEQSVQHFWRESYGQIYPSLRELEVLGWVTRKSESNSGRPDKQVYALTSDGRSNLQGWLATLAKPEVPRNEMLLKIFFGRLVPTEVSLRQLATHREMAQETLEGYAATEVQIRTAHHGNPGLPYWLLTLSYGRRYAEAEIAWCDEAAAILKETKTGDL